MKKLDKTKEELLLYLKKKKVCVTKRTICRDLKAKAYLVDKACTLLRKEKKAGFTKSYVGKFPYFDIKSYWGVR